MATYIGTADIPRRRPGQGHRRGQICRRIQRPRPRLRLSSSNRPLPKGRIARIDTSEALRVAGVLDVLTHREPAADGRQRRRLQGRCRAGRRLAVPPALRRQDPVQRPADRAGAGRGLGDRALRRLAGADRISEASRTSPTCMRSASKAFVVEKPEKPRGDADEGLCGGRRAPRGRVFHPDRAPQSDGIVRLDGGVGRRRQAHGLRQDAGRAERAAISVRRVRDEAGRRARDVALYGRRLRLGLRPQYQVVLAVLGALRAEAPGARSC